MSNVGTVLTPKAETSNPATGISDHDRKELSAKLSEVLAATYRLMIKSHIYHWNVVGPLFKPIHDLTEDHYNAMFAATDEIAERIRALGHLAPLQKSVVADFAPQPSSVDHLTAEEMVKDLIIDHEAASQHIRSVGEAAGEADDFVTEDLMTSKLEFHEQAIWMLRATIAD